MENSTNSKLNFKKVLVAKLNDSQMNSIMGGNANYLQENTKYGNLKATTPGDVNFTNIDTTVMESYFCKF